MTKYETKGYNMAAKGYTADKVALEAARLGTNSVRGRAVRKGFAKYHGNA
jgi:hypothetical protein